ncbi:MAG: lipid-A-disaccharide synthase [Chitinophagales bacterium]|nr:lipid-A-disaccharide synthase [Chitinophagales bacterium]
MKYYIIAGEASGDLHGSNLIKSIKQEDSAASFRFWGGDLMAAEAGNPIKHYRDLAFMGFVEVLLNIRTILNNIRFCKKDILDFKPDALILIDYPGFNLRIAKWAKQQGIPVHYYISPQIWAWHSSRVHGIKKSVDHMYVILPFEKDFYAKYDYPVNFVGHPLLDVVHDYEKEDGFRQKHQLGDKPLIALLPGSRKQEIERLLNVMLQVITNFPDYQFVIAGAPSQDESYYQSIIDQSSIPAPVRQNIRFISNKTYQLLLHSEAALVTSGTATLETALFDVPQVVCYKGSPLSYHIARRLINVSYISLVNLIVDKEIVKELIQHECNPENISTALTEILDPQHQKELYKEYQNLKEELGNAGASQRTAKLITKYSEK